MIQEAKARRDDRIYVAAIIVSFLFHLRHMFRLPILLTYDGYLYIDLASVLGGPRFPADWDFLRTPIFPLALKLAFSIFGEVPLAVLAVQSTFGFLGICAVAGALKREGQTIAAAGCALTLTLFPTLVTYEHAVLSEVGTFFFLALLLNVLLWRPSRVGLKTSILTVVLIAGFYYRPTFLSLTPVVVSLYVASLMAPSTRSRIRAGEPVSLKWREAGVHGFLILALTVGAAQFWQQQERWKERSGGQFLYGMVRAGAFSEADPIWGGSDLYQKAIRESQVGGRLPFSGLIEGKEYALHALISGRSREGERIFLETVLESPGTYLAAVGRSLFSLAGLDPVLSETRLFRRLVMSRDPQTSRILPGPESLSRLTTQFAQDLGPSHTADLMYMLGPIYDAAVSISFLVALGILGVSVARRDLSGLTWTLVPLQFWALHAFILNPIDRMAVPCYPILLAGLFALLPRLFSLRRTPGPLVPGLSEQ